MGHRQATAFIAGPVAIVVLTTGCGVGDFFGDGPSGIIVQNDTSSSVHVGRSDDEDGVIKLTGTTIEAGQAGEVGWTECYASWLIVRASKQVSSKEHGRFELELCPGDLVTIGSDYVITVGEP